MWCRSKKLLLLKTDHTPLVSARSCVAALASQASSFNVCLAPDSDGNADIAEGPSYAIRVFNAVQQTPVIRAQMLKPDRH